MQGIKNGRLLRLAADNGFDALITTDAGIPHQQNPATVPVAIVVLAARSNKLGDLLPLVSDVLQALAVLSPRSIVHVPVPGGTETG